MSPW
jgi:DNA-binding IclR family transcriptional regulator